MAARVVLAAGGLLRRGPRPVPAEILGFSIGGLSLAVSLGKAAVSVNQPLTVDLDGVITRLRATRVEPHDVAAGTTFVAGGFLDPDPEIVRVLERVLLERAG